MLIGKFELLKTREGETGFLRGEDEGSLSVYDDDGGDDCKIR